MLNNQLYALRDGINRCGDLKGIKFSYALLKNKRKVESELKRITDIVPADPEYLKFVQKREEIVQKYAEKDKKGEFKERYNGMIKEYVVKKENKKKCDSEIAKLRKKYKDVIEKRDEKVKEMNLEFDKECTIEFHKVKQKDLPQDISARQIEIISQFMYDEKE